MAEKEQKTQKKIEKNTEVEELNQVDSSRNNELTAELDGLLDEIDEVLETNAEEFEKKYGFPPDRVRDYYGYGDWAGDSPPDANSGFADRAELLDYANTLRNACLPLKTSNIYGIKLLGIPVGRSPNDPVE